jgi:choline dehydrogenase
MYVDAIPDDAVFDYIVVGAGSAGCVVASRLSEESDNHVLLIEAGGRDTSINTRIPVLVANILRDELFTWPFMTEPQVHANGQRHLWVRGKLIGGSGSINGSIYVRGDPLEYDAWSSHGCAGWSYSELLPYFKRLENFPEGDPAVRGRGGPIGVRKLDEFSELSEAFLRAADQAGFREVSDYNDGVHYAGTAYTQLSTRRGLRSNSGYEYLRPASRRKNLTILTHATAARVLMDGKRATGVEFLIHGGRMRARARREVIVSAGALQSPKLLELSGIGDADVLRRHGIAVSHHLPGVGENLRDHTDVRLSFQCTKPITINDVMNSPWRKLKEGAKFIFLRRGLLTISSTTVRAILKSSPELAQPDLTLRLLPRSGKDRYARSRRYGSDDYSGFSIGVTVLQPRSIGSVHVASSDPMQQAIMDPRYLSAEDDVRLVMHGLRLVRQLASSPPLKSLIVKEMRPGPDVVSDEAMLDYVRATTSTSWHTVGTCKMGVDSMSVVDPELRVHGIAGLRVVDASICPTIPSTNTNAPTLAIAEKGAAMILETGQRPSPARL